MRAILPSILLIAFVFGLGFLVRIACAVCSEKAVQRMKRRPILHCFWAVPGLYSALVLLLFFDPELINIWPPHWLELKRQREIVLQKVQAAGGWERLRQDCVTFASTNQDGAVLWIRWNTNHINLPATIAALNPQEIRYCPVSMLSKGNPNYPVVRLRIFGMHSTGGHSTPYYGLDVIVEKETTPYQIPPAPFASGNSHFRYHKIADGIYEVY